MFLFASFFFYISFAVAQGNEITTRKFDPKNMDPTYLVAKKKTPLTEQQVADTLCESYLELHGKFPSKNRLAIGWAQIALENSRGKKIWNNNIGNQGPFRMDQEYYHHLRKGWPYRSFKTPKQSGISYWNIISKCSMASQAFDAGNPVVATAYLKKCNYFSSDLNQYTQNLVSLYYEAQQKIIPKVNCGN